MNTYCTGLIPVMTSKKNIMKVKLLKKVRKRFEILHLPQGFYSFGVLYDYNLFKLIDLDNEFFEYYSQCGFKEGQRQFVDSTQIFETEKECIDFKKSKIIKILISEGYSSVKIKKTKTLIKKVWYN